MMIPSHGVTKDSGWPRRWRVIGHDTFAHENYGLGWFHTREEAMAAARKAVAYIEYQQPNAGELQDQVTVYDPDDNYVPIDPE